MWWCMRTTVEHVMSATFKTFNSEYFRKFPKTGTGYWNRIPVMRRARAFQFYQTYSGTNEQWPPPGRRPRQIKAIIKDHRDNPNPRVCLSCVIVVIRILLYRVIQDYLIILHSFSQSILGFFKFLKIKFFLFLRRIKLHTNFLFSQTTILQFTKWWTRRYESK